MQRRGFLTSVSLFALLLGAAGPLPLFPPPAGKQQQPLGPGFASAGPTLDFNFLTSGALDPSITFTRASGATYFDATGTLQTATSNTPRFGSGPATSGVTNLSFPSVSGHSSTWALLGTGTITNDAAVAPDASTTATMLAADATNGTHGYSLAGNITPGGSAFYTASVYVKAGTTSKVNLDLRVGTDWVGGVIVGTFDLAAVTGTATSNGTASIVAVGGGWYRISTTGQAVASPPASLVVWAYLRNSAGATSFAGAGETAYFWGFQFEQSSTAGGYVATTTAIASGFWSRLGLLIEEARTNSIRNPRAEGSTTGTPGVLPTGWLAQGAQPNIVGTGTEQGIPYIDIRMSDASGSSIWIPFFLGLTTQAATNGQTWVASAYLRIISGSLTGYTDASLQIRTYDTTPTQLQATNTGTLTITPAALATQRFSIVQTNSNASTAWVSACLRFSTSASGPNAVTIRVGAPQLELGSFPTSTILPAVGTPAATTRAADVATMPVGAWFNSAAGTLAGEGIYNGEASTTFTRLVGLVGANVNNDSIDVFRSGPSGLSASAVRSGGTNEGAANVAVTLGLGAVVKQAVGYINASSAAAANGAASSYVALTTPFTVPTITSLSLGAAISFQPTLTGYIRRVRYWPRALSTSELQAATT